MSSKTNLINCHECHKLPTNWDEWLKCNNNCFLEYNVFSKSRKKITSSRQRNTQGIEENIIKIMTETWI